ncbi:hypothetical protein Q4485_13400 [Granulosicoccaceae sp. 1_MG-2023]|nr:hypothetical protein [Granulosicoccaceae sp. 1_MG-2023]
MADKSGGDIMQGNTGVQGNAGAQDLNAVGVGGVGAVDGLGGSSSAMGLADQYISQAQNQANMAVSGNGGNDNINANTTINIA